VIFIGYLILVASQFRYVNRFRSYVNRFRSYVNRFRSYVNRFRSNVYRFRSYVNRFRSYVNSFRSYVYRFRSYVSRFRSYVNRFRSYVNNFRSYVNRFRSYVNRFRSYINSFRSYESRFRSYESRFRIVFVATLSAFTLFEEIGAARRHLHLTRPLKREHWLETSFCEHCSHIIRIMDKPYVIPAVHRSLNSKNFLVQKKSGGKVFGGKFFYNRTAPLKISYFLASSENICWIFKVKINLVPEI
jgi:hypothetical protein